MSSIQDSWAYSFVTEIYSFTPIKVELFSLIPRK